MSHAQERAREEPTREQPNLKAAAGAIEELAAAQGHAYLHALDTMLAAAPSSGKQEAGDYLVAFAVEPVRGMYRLVDGHWVWSEPVTENIHLQIMVADRYDGRFVPGLEIYALLFDKDHNELGERRQRFNWHPWLHHYGRDWTVAKNGPYHLRVRIELPDFPRHDRQRGARYEAPVEVDFRRISM